MVQKNIRYNQKLMVALINVCEAHGRLHDALAVRSDMDLSGMAIDETIYHALIRVCIKGGRVEDARKLKEQMEDKAMTLTVETYNYLILTCVAKGLYKVLFQVFFSWNDVKLSCTAV